MNGSTSPFHYSVDQHVADIWDQYAQHDFYPVPLRVQPYYDDAQNMGNGRQPFVSLAYRAQHGALTIYSVWQVDGAAQALAQGLTDKATSAETYGPTGQVCIDRNRGNIAYVLDSDYGEGDWDLHQAATFSRQAGFTVTEDPNPAEFGTPPAPPDLSKCCALLRLHSLNHYNYNNVFTWNTGAIGFHLDSASAPNPRRGPNWSANAIINGITVTTGSVNELYLQGLFARVTPSAICFRGANLGDAFLRNTRWLKCG